MQPRHPLVCVWVLVSLCNCVFMCTCLARQRHSVISVNEMTSMCPCVLVVPRAPLSLLSLWKHWELGTLLVSAQNLPLCIQLGGHRPCRVYDVNHYHVWDRTDDWIHETWVLEFPGFCQNLNKLSQGQSGKSHLQILHDRACRLYV